MFDRRIDMRFCFFLDKVYKEWWWKIVIEWGAYALLAAPIGVAFLYSPPDRWTWLGNSFGYLLWVAGSMDGAFKKHQFSHITFGFLRYMQVMHRDDMFAFINDDQYLAPKTLFLDAPGVVSLFTRKALSIMLDKQMDMSIHLTKDRPLGELEA